MSRKTIGVTGARGFVGTAFEFEDLAPASVKLKIGNEVIATLEWSGSDDSHVGAIVIGPHIDVETIPHADGAVLALKTPTGITVQMAPEKGRSK